MTLMSDYLLTMIKQGKKSSKNSLDNEMNTGNINLIV